MLHSPGDRLGPYEIVRFVGEGGMGEVYEARDTRLERTVAVHFAGEPLAERFRSGAVVASGLNHPHICALFDVGPDYVVMEYAEGTPLRGPLPAGEAVRLAFQIVDALEHAHRHGVVHGDLKPANIRVTPTGVKVLAFGLSSRGHMADAPTDIFAFGLLLYEMLTGHRSVPHDRPAFIAPTELQQVVMTCLAEDPRERWQSFRELRHGLARASRPEGVSAHRSARAWTTVVVATALLGVAVGFSIVRDRRTARPLAMRFEVVLPEKAMLRWTEPLAVSPDGRQIAFSLLFPGRLPQLFLRPLGAVTVTAVAGAEGGAHPFWSPDGRQIGFLAVPGGLRKMSLSGGPAQTLCPLVNQVGATWSQEDVIVFSDSGRLFRVSGRGGDPRSLGPLAAGETARVWPQFLPDGRHYLYLSRSARPEDHGIYVGALDSDLRKPIVATAYNAAYSSGRLLFIKDGALMVQPFDAQRLELSGEPRVLVDQVAALTGLPGLAQFSVSASGVLAWHTGSPAETKQLTWFDRSGRRVGTLGEPAIYYRPVLSPDEKSVAICREETGTNADIWIVAVAGGASRRLTFDSHYDCGPAWSPDGTRIAFRSDRRGVPEIYQKRADGSGEDELLLASKDSPLNVTDWSADGRFLVYNAPRPGSLQDLFVLPLAPSGEKRPIPYVATESLEDSAAVAPNCRWITYRSTQHGRFEIYVRELSSQGQAGSGTWQISSGGGWAPRWRRDGQELFFATGSGILAARVRTDGPTFESEPPRRLFDPGLVEEPGTAFEVTRDGQRFLMLVPVKPREPIRVLVNGLS